MTFSVAYKNFVNIFTAWKVTANMSASDYATSSNITYRVVFGITGSPSSGYSPMGIIAVADPIKESHAQECEVPVEKIRLDWGNPQSQVGRNSVDQRE